MRIILTTILMLVCLVAYSATPSYSNFSSNQFSPSGTYTVTVKNQPLLTNIVEHALLSLTNPAFEVSLMTISNNGNSLTVNSNTLLVTSNRVGISTNSPGCTLDINAPYGANLEFQVCTGGVPVVSVSNSYFRAGGGVNTLLIHPGTKTSLGSGEGMAFMPNGASPTALFSGDIWDFRDTGNPRFLFGDNSGAYYGGLKWDSLYRATKLGVAASEGSITIKTNSNVGVNCSNAVASFQADAQYGAQLQFVFSTNGTPVMVISNGLVGIGKENPGSALDVVGTVSGSSGFTGAGNALSTQGYSMSDNHAVFWNSATTNTPSIFEFANKTNLVGFGDASGAIAGTVVFSGKSGAGIVLHQMYQNPTPYESSTNTLIYSQGTNLYIGDGITANSSNVATMQFSFQTSGTPVMVISNGLVGIGLANPARPLDVVGNAGISGTLFPGSIDCGSGSAFLGYGAGPRFIYVGGNSGTNSPTLKFFSGFGTNLIRIGDGDLTATNSGGGLVFIKMYGDPTPYEASTNTLVYSDGNALHVSDSLIINSNVFPITANFGNMKPCGCVTWMSNFTCYMICTNSADGNATTNKLGGL